MTAQERNNDGPDQGDYGGGGEKQSDPGYVCKAEDEQSKTTDHVWATRKTKISGMSNKKDQMGRL